MAKASVSPADARKNQAIVYTLIDDAPKEVSATVGINALGELADLMPHEDFVRWIDGAIHHATTGEIPPDQDEQQDQSQQQTTQGQPPAGS